MDHFTYRHADLGFESKSPSAVDDVVGTPGSLRLGTTLLEQDGGAHFLKAAPLDGHGRGPARRRLGETCKDPVTEEETS